MKEKPTLKQEDFIKKYYGYKILDRIDEIVSAEIGDEDRLFSIYEKIKKKKEFDADEIQYLMDCSEELDKKGTELPTNKKKISGALLGDDPSSPLYTKGTSGFYGKRNVGKRKITIAIIIPIMFILLVGIIMSSDDSPSDLEKKLTADFASDEQNIAWNIIKSYRGSDDEGSNLFDTIITQIENVYPNEKILQHRDTWLEISVLDIREQKDVGFYEIKFTFQTYDDVREYIWNVNIETEEIISINDGARKMMNIVDFYGKPEIQSKPTTTTIHRTEDLPQSCDGINAVRYDLYPNLDECLDAIVERINFACYAKSNGDEYETIGCVLDLTSLLNEQCQGSEDMGLLSVSFEACLWNQYYHVYKNLGNFCWKDEDMMQCLADVKIGK